MSPRVLVAGIGNIFLGDDGFGVEVAGRLAGQSFPDGVCVADYGIRGVHLAYELLDGYDALVLVDAVPMGEAPGTVALIEPAARDDAVADESNVMNAHDMNPSIVLDTVAALGGTIGRVVIVGCQPATLEEGIGLSPPVAEAVDRAVEACHEIVADVLASADLTAPASIGTGKDTCS